MRSHGHNLPRRVEAWLAFEYRESGRRGKLLVDEGVAVEGVQRRSLLSIPPAYSQLNGDEASEKSTPDWRVTEERDDEARERWVGEGSLEMLATERSEGTIGVETSVRATVVRGCQ